MKKKALITGITGQDGSYLAELLINKGYEVHGIVRRSSTTNRDRIDHLTNPDLHTGPDRGDIILHYGDMSDAASIEKAIKEIMPDELYNLAAQSHVRVSFDLPVHTAEVVGLGTLVILEAIKNFSPKTKFYQASSSEMFGEVLETPQKETTPFAPRSPYACAKVFGYHITRNYRESYGLFACNGILFNHESERRGESFVTRKITRSLARMKLGLQQELYLGNLDAERDWGHAKDYVEAMWLMLQQEKPADYVIGFGEKHSVRDFLEMSAKALGIELISNGLKGVDESYTDRTGKLAVKIHPRYFRPAEVDLLLADTSKAKSILGWSPKISFKELVDLMCDHDLKLAEKEKMVKQGSQTSYNDRISNNF